MISSMQSSNSWNSPPPRNPRGSIRSVYDAAATQQAGDYDSIMSGYNALKAKAANRSGQPPVTFNPINSTTRNVIQGEAYQRPEDLAGLIKNLQGFSETGGYSGQDISNLRERGISPIRSAYANASRNVNRQSSLQGGYSPNKGALQAKLAREQGGLTADAMTNVNARIAEMVQSGKLSGFNALSPLLTRENELRTGVDERNTAMQNEVAAYNAAETSRINQLNAQMGMNAQQFNANQGNANDNVELSALSGMSNLYGTTPALTNTFGNQVLQNNQQRLGAVQTANTIKNQRAGLGWGVAKSNNWG